MLIRYITEDNGLYGTIPSELSSLGSTLEEIDLSYNKLDLSSIPSELSSLTKLNALFLQGNYFEAATDPKINNNDNTNTNDSDKSKSTSTSSDSYKYTLNDVFCNIETEYVIYDNLISEFVADCNTKKGNVPCFCCTLCCDEHDNCTTDDDNHYHNDGQEEDTKDFEMVSVS